MAFSGVGPFAKTTSETSCEGADSGSEAYGLDVFCVLFGAIEAENAKSLTESSQHARTHLLSLELRDQAYGNFAISRERSRG